LLGRDGAKVKDLFGAQLNAQSRFDLSSDARFASAAGRYGFASGKSTHADRLQTIRDVFEQHGVMIDTHTADGVKVAREHLQTGTPMIVLETALPIKFAATIVQALGREPSRPVKFEGIELLPKRVQVMKPDVATIMALIEKSA
jgi:threonine synthase